MKELKNITKAIDRAHQIFSILEMKKKRGLRKTNQTRLDILLAEEKEGIWVVCGNSYPVKDALKERGFSYYGDKKSWYSHNEINIDDLNDVTLIEG